MTDFQLENIINATFLAEIELVHWVFHHLAEATAVSYALFLSLLSFFQAEEEEKIREIQKM